MNALACNCENQAPVSRKTAGSLYCFVPDDNLFVSLTPCLNPVLASIDQMTLKSWPDISFGSLFPRLLQGTKPSFNL